MADVSRVRMTGPLVTYAAGFAAELGRQGYRRNPVVDQVRLMAHLSRWMSAAGLEVGDLIPSTRAAFLAARRAEGYSLWLSPKALAPLMAYLRAVGVVGDDPAAVLNAAGRLLEEYRGFLVGERGLTSETAAGYVHAVRPFVTDGNGEVVDLAGLTPGDVTGFVLRTCPGRSKGSAKMTVTALRSVLGYLFVTGAIPNELASAVPSVAGWRLAGLPKGLEPAQVRSLLAVFDQRTAAGRRDRAMTLLMVRLGLRAGEVRRLGLEDFDWRAGEVAIRGKGRRLERLPLPADVGDAVAGYLRRGRPASAEGRCVFVRVHAPHRPLTSGAVTDVVSRAAGRAGLGAVRAHALRHTAATQMVRAGASLPEVGQVLRHRLLLTTAIYAKVDREGLRSIARPWLGCRP
jgi:integrase/recombinase XerD